MAKVNETEEDEQYATSVEVDGIRRTLTSLMQKQWASNEAMQKSSEDKGSSFKGNKP